MSSFGVDKVFPRLQVQSGQKEASFEDTTGSQGEDLGSDCVSSWSINWIRMNHSFMFAFASLILQTYSYRDEHSGPFSWMTRSQQELSFESGPIEYIDGVEELDVLTASPSRVLNRQSLLIRQSKGNPIYSKPVGIPIVPTIEKKVERKSSDKMAAAPVSPHKINNFVYEEDNRIVLDFGPSSTSDAEKSGGAAEGNNKAATKENGNNFLDRVKNTKNTLKKSLSNVSHGGTLRRRKSQSKSQKSSPTHSPASTLSASFRLNPPTGSGTSGYSPTSTMSSSFASASLPRQHSQSSTMSIKQLGNHSPTSTISSRSGHVSITKPTMAPPPPPPNVNKPTAAPPPPPPQSHQMSKSLYVPSTSSSTSGTNSSATRSQEPKEPLASYEKEPKAAEVQPRKEADDVVKPLEEFKIDLNTGSVSVVT